jgi:hypothetical protein
MDYAEYLESEHWKVTRANIRHRAGGWCERCLVNKQTDVHHLSYERLGNELSTDLLAVCRYCHSFLHGKSYYDPASIHYTQEQVEYFRLLIVSGYEQSDYWKDLAYNEPRLMKLHLRAINRFEDCLIERPHNCPVFDNGVDEYYCAECAWIDELKPLLIKLVGDYSTSTYPPAQTVRAYDTAYQTVYHAIPTCPRMIHER